MRRLYRWRNLIEYTMKKERISYLLQQYESNLASREEAEELLEWMRSAGGKKVLKGLILNAGETEDKEISLSQQDWDRMWSGIASATIAGRKTRIYPLSLRMQVAAAVILLIMAGAAYQVFKKRDLGIKAPVAVNGHDRQGIFPGSNKAVLTLASGATILLDSAHKGLIGQQGNTSILKVNAGALTYNTKNKNTGNTLYNSISTPRGGQYEVVLADGSKIWLNAASSLRFPTSFAGKERLVELTGEAYFEIAKNAAMPFRVKVLAGGSGGNSLDVQVLGTSFDIMAYTNEQNVNTTLLEGAVKLVVPPAGEHSSPTVDAYKGRNEEEVMLQPGRQVTVNNKTHAINTAEANTEQALAWKNGFFRFKETNIRELMRQVERWYDVDVVFKTERDDQDYTGIVPRTQNIWALLKTLEMTGTVHFQIEGRKIIVLP